MAPLPEPIAVVGTACRFPGGSDDPSKLWELLKNPRDLSKKIPRSRFNTDGFYHPEATHHGTTNATKSYFLDSDVAHFDAGFFSIPADPSLPESTEADAIDPQQRFLLETVYDGISAAGLPMEKLRGSQTAVYVGMMCDDWSSMVYSDLDGLPTYTATATARSIVSNRISYFFDWHGPSMTIDTACSSSLVAVHQAIQTLRGGQSNIAVAAGTNLILSPGMYVSESNLRMLSPTGHCSMWDAKADGYARGEGVAAVVLKTLSQALADGDSIECIIRETGVNQDGRTSGITMPSNTAQASLIRSTYQRAGLDLNNPRDRPQFFHAHGTGTQAGDPQEAEAISSSMFPTSESRTLEATPCDKLWVGSIKTVIGHTEGTAGLASLIGTIQAMKNNTIPPNLHFRNLSPKVAPFFGNLRIPTTAMPWPERAAGQPKRASVNSFGFGGTNAHAIVESWDGPQSGHQDARAHVPAQDTTNRSSAVNNDTRNESPLDPDAPGDDDLVHEPTAASTLFTPLTFSAATPKALEQQLRKYADYLEDNPAVSIQDLAWTLQERRSTLPYRKVVTGPSARICLEKLQAMIEEGLPTKDTRQSTLARSPKILGIFTGQGAQWARMGARLVETSALCQDIIADLDEGLQSLPVEDRPTWTLKEQLLASSRTSRIGEAALSQPLCTAIQVVLVGVLRAAGIRLEAVVGHSSGEMGAAYAAGLLSAHDAIRIAYYRGLYAGLASSPDGKNMPGSMIAVGTSFEEAAKLCSEDRFQGRIQIAAVNSGSSVTLSGDDDMIDVAASICKEKKLFARKLLVDTAYHSRHMASCAAPYLEAMQRITMECPVDDSSDGTAWYSSVFQGATRMSKDTLTDQYWVDNMCNTVLFSRAVAEATSKHGAFDLVLEVGPHPALKGPATATLEEVGPAVPYFGLLSRGKDDVEVLGTTLGAIWAQLGSGHVDFKAVQKALSGGASPKVLGDLPCYPFDHTRQYWTGSRVVNSSRYRRAAPNPVLGILCSEGVTATELQWKNILRPSEISWLKGHKLQGQVVFPATGYVAQAVEAMKALAEEAGEDISCFEVFDLAISRAITFKDESSSVETVFTVSSVEHTDDGLTAHWACSTVAPGGSATILNAKGSMAVSFSAAKPDTIPSTCPLGSRSLNLVDVNVGRFYGSLSKLSYAYSDPFQAVSHIQRKPGYSTGFIHDQSGSEWEDQLVVHPGMLDSALQTAFAAWSFPGDGMLKTLHVPTKIRSIVVNPYYTPLVLGKQNTIQFRTFTRRAESHVQGQIADIHLFASGGEGASHSLAVIEGCVLQPFSPPSADDDVPLFSTMHYRVASPDGGLVVDAPQGGRVTDATASICQMAFQIVHRYPRVRVLEIGSTVSGTAGDEYDTIAQTLIPSIRASIHSYTLTAGDSTLLDKAQKSLKEAAQSVDSMVVFQTLDVDIPVAEQDFATSRYDIVIVPQGFGLVDKSAERLGNIRRLLRAGGYLIALADGGISEALLDAKALGFSGIDTRTSTVLVSQAVDENVAVLRDPLAESAQVLQDVRLDQLAIIGGATTWTRKVVNEALDLLSVKYASASVFSSVEEFAAAEHTFAAGLNILCLTDLDEPFLQDLSQDRFESLKALWRSARTLLWATLDGCDHAMMLGIARTVKNESPTLNLQFVTLLGHVQAQAEASTSHSTARILSENLLRFHMLNTWSVHAADLLWSVEPELVVEQGGRILIPRLLPDTPKNDRYNSRQRTIVKNILVPVLQESESESESQPVALVSVDGALELQHISPLARLPARPPAMPSSRTICITKSLLQSVVVGAAGFLRLCLGVDAVTRAPVLALSDSATSPAVVLPELCIDIHPDSASLRRPATTLLTVATRLVASRIVSLVPRGSILLLHGADRALMAAIRTLAADKTVEVVFATMDQAISGDDVVHLHPRLSRCNIKQLIPASTAVFVHLPRGGNSSACEARAVERLIKKCLPPHCVCPSAASILGNHVQAFHHRMDSGDILWITSELHNAWRGACGVAGVDAVDMPDGNVLSLQHVSGLCPSLEPLSVVDWTACASVSAKMQPVDSEGTILFRSDKTYLFVGMAGEVGQSLAHWMIRHGARFIVLASRTPKVKPEFIRCMAVEHEGAVVRPMTLDITSGPSLLQCHALICESMPEIAGVVNGAMILQDSLFESMTHDQFLRVLQPKVQGTKLLDSLFRTTALDFFVVTSSVTMIVGWGGQANYSAANLFMTAMMAQRRKRGLAGSSLAIPAIAGVGHAAQEGNFDFEHATSVGLINISEEDLWTMFAEAVLSGRPSNNNGNDETPGTRTTAGEIVTGVNYVPADLNVNFMYRRDAKFAHFVLDEDSSGSGADDISAMDKTTVKLRDQLKNTNIKSDDGAKEAFDTITAAFVTKIKTSLSISDEETIDESVALIERGVDSLVAVEIRSWFLKEVDVDVPVLKVLSGSSITDLIKFALEVLTARVQVATPPPAAPSQQAPVAEDEKPKPRANNVTETTIVTVVAPSLHKEKEVLVHVQEVFADAASITSISPPETVELRTPSESDSESGCGATTDFQRGILRVQEMMSSSRAESTTEMSFGQSRFWFLHHFLKDKTVSNFSVCVRLAGPLRVQAFERAINTVIRRHDIFQTRYFWSEGSGGGDDSGVPMQGILSHPVLRLEKKQIMSEEEAQQELEELQRHVYDLENWGAVRMKLLSLSSGDSDAHYFMIGCHHIAMDGHSIIVLLDQVNSVYGGQTLPLMSAESQYACFGSQQRQDYTSGKLADDVAYFREHLQVQPVQAAGAIELFPFAKMASRTALESYRLNTATAHLGTATVTKIGQLARKNACTNFHVYLTALQALVFGMLPETESFFVGIADSNRLDDKFVGTIGCLVNLLPIRFDRSTSMTTVSDSVKVTRSKVYAALAHSRIPFDVLMNELNITRSSEHSPIFQVSVDYRRDAREKLTVCGLDTDVNWIKSSTGYDVQMEIVDLANGDAQAVLKLQDSLYSQAHTDMFLRSYTHFLEQMVQVSDSSRSSSSSSVATCKGQEMTLASLSPWSVPDTQAALQVARGAVVHSTWPATLVHRIDDMVEAHSDSTALKDGHGNVLSYSQMADRINIIAIALGKAGVEEGMVVGVFQEPAADWVCSMLAILRIGATYVPLDLKNGVDRVKGAISVSKPRVILSDKWTNDQVGTVQVDGVKATTLNVSDMNAGDASYPPAHVVNVAKAPSVGMILFTSGSTGAPKGIMLTHGGLRNHMEAVKRHWNPEGGNVVLQQATMSFDPAAEAIFIALAYGGTLLMVPSALRGNPFEITKWMAQERVTHTCATPSEYGMWLEACRENLTKCTAWQWAFCGGEYLSQAVLEEFAALNMDRLKLYNVYGPAEATFCITQDDVPYKQIADGVDVKAAPSTGCVGRVIPDHLVMIWDKLQQPVPIGVSGEVIVGGPGVATGYLGLDDLTAEKFIQRSLPDGTGVERLYRTGDRGRLDAEGALYFEGRIDGHTQIKLLGVRIEVGEIESAIVTASAGRITRAAVSLRKQQDVADFLVAFIVFSKQSATAESEDADQSGYLASLRSKLAVAPFMRPAVFVPMEEFPINAHGKTDHNALQVVPLPSVAIKTQMQPSDPSQDIPLTELESQVCELWARILPPQSTANFTPETDFFHVGGNSLLLVKLQRLIKQRLNATARLIDLMNTSTLREMSRIIEDSTATAKVLDWTIETAVPEAWVHSFATRARKVTRGEEKINVLMTGATGYLGRSLLPALVNDERVAKVILLVRDATKLTTTSPKIQVVHCDLSLDKFGLSPEHFGNLGSEVDVIIHPAASRSFWDGYEALRAVNMTATKALAQIALQNSLPFHFFSSGVVDSEYSSQDPPTDGSDGYVATKWAAERFLRNVASQLGLPVCIHVPKAAPDETSFSLDADIARHLVELSMVVGARPSLERLSGHLDLFETRRFVDGILASVLSSDEGFGGGGGVRVEAKTVCYESKIRIDMDHSLAALMVDEKYAALPAMDALAWMGELKANGFAYVLAGQHLIMTSDSGQIVSRR